MASAGGVMKSVARRCVAGVCSMAEWLRPGAEARAPWDRSILDDIAMRRPWNLVVKASRLRGRIRLRSLRDGVTVVIVNWNTCEVTADVISAVQHFSPPDVRVLVVDNGSTDASVEMLRNRMGVETMFLHSNAGHGAALDIAVSSVRTRVAVTLDSDAIPLSPDWLEPAVAPVRAGRALLAGSRSSRNFVHPIYLAVDVAEFVRRNLSFQVHRRPAAEGLADHWGVNAWDTAELLTPRLPADRVVFVDTTPNSAEDLPGMTAGGVVYHHGGVSRTASGKVDADALAKWSATCAALGLAFLERDTSS